VRLAGFVLSLWVLFGAPLARAAPSLMASMPVVDRDADAMILLVGGISEEGATVKPSSIEVDVDGAPGPAPKSVEVFSEYAEAAAEKSQAWKSPLAVGLVYLWVKEVPAGLSDAILEGVEGFVHRIPARSNVYVTLYGRKRQPIPKLKASEIGGQLHDLGYLAGDRPNLADAIRVDLKALLGDESPFKVMVVVTDGRDYNDATGDSAADFGAIADELDRAQVKLMVVSFPPSEVDAEQSTRNLGDLASAGAFRRAADQPIEVESTLESLGQAIADMRRVKIELPWAWRTLGGTHKLRLNVTSEGKRRAIEVGKITVEAGMTWVLLVLGLVVGALAIAGVTVLAVRRRGAVREPEVAEESSAVIAAAHALVGRGVPAQRALVELTRSYPNDVGLLADLEPALISAELYPVFHTQAGRRRLEQIQSLLSHQPGENTRLGADLAEVLAQAISTQTPPEQAASGIAARVPEDQWSAFVRLGLDSLARALRASGTEHPVLATPRARGVALEIQAALRSDNRSSGKSLTVGWLVRTSGQGRRGETLRLPVGEGSVVLGRGPGCPIRFEGDPEVLDQHAVISERAGAFAIEPLPGALLKLETKPVSGSEPLGDGDTIELGKGCYVFKCVSVGHIAESRPGA